jgi:hypothetical protein
MLNRRGHQWLLKVALAGKWTRAAVVVVVMACVQAVYWGVWSLSADERQPAPVQTSNAGDDGADVEFELASWMTPEQMAAWQMPKAWFDKNGQAKLDHMHDYWAALEKLAIGQGLDVNYQVSANSVDWHLTGDFGGVMTWLHELTDNHPRLVMQRLHLLPIEPGTWVKADIQLGVQALGPQGFGPGSEAPTPFELAAFKPWAQTRATTQEALDGFDGGAGVSPLGLARWFDQLADEGWWNDGQAERLTALQLLPLSHIQWVGSLMQGPSAMAMLSAGDQVWHVRLGDRVGQGLSRVLDIQADQVFVEVLTPDGQGLLQRREVVLGAASP